MEERGIISADQAARLRASIRPGDEAEAWVGRSRRSLAPYVGAAVVLAVVVLILVLAGGPGPVQEVSQSLNETGATGAMNRSVLNIIAIALLLIIPLVLLAVTYNSLVNREEAVFQSWAQVESQFQRRADLVPALIETVSGYVAHERGTLEAVTASRSRMLADAVDSLARSQAELAAQLGRGEALLEEQSAMDDLERIQAQLSARLSGFIALAEDYPELRASDPFLELQAQLEGSENRINVARLRFNDAVGRYNAAIRRLPGTLVAGLGDFRRKAYFKADEGAEQAPEVEFD
jgi:LemA protein